MDDLEKVARALCAVGGGDPEELVNKQPAEMEPYDSNGRSRQVQVPQWHRHQEEAARWLAAYRAVTS